MKKSFDTESMYNKIMPSSIIPNVNSNTDESISKQESEKEEILLTDNRISSEVAIDQQNEETTELHNMMEILVKEKIANALEKIDCCKCDRCKKEILALALNQLTPKYFVGTQKELQKELLMYTAKMKMEPSTAVLRAVLDVKKNPRH